MRFSRKIPHSHALELNLTAMVDVVFQLIVFFIATAHFAYQSQADIDLPTERGEGPAEIAITPIEINILTDEAMPYLIGGRRMDLRTALEWASVQVAKAAESGAGPDGLEITIRADRSASSRAVNELGRGLHMHGVSKWRLAVREQ